MITENRGGLSAFVHAECGVWRRGETVHLLALVRGVTGQAPAPVPLRWRFRRPDWKIWREEVVPTLASAEVLSEVTFPNDLPAGNWQVELTLLGDEKNQGATCRCRAKNSPRTHIIFAGIYCNILLLYLN